MPRYVSSPSMGLWHRGIDQFCSNEGSSLTFSASAEVVTGGPRGARIPCGSLKLISSEPHECVRCKV